MPATTRRTSSRSKSKPKTAAGTRTKKAPGTRSSTGRKSTSRKTRAHKTLEETTYVYECTRPGCNYRIVRDEKAEQNQLRYDLKCPKCHHQEFRCMGAGDLAPEEHHVPMVEVDFGAFKSIGLGAN